MFIGKGAYGSVEFRDGMAIKKLKKLSHAVQEYTALQYLKDCKYVVHPISVDFSDVTAPEIKMQLYNCSLRDWFNKKKEAGSVNNQEILTLLRDVLRGLVELHDRGLTHGDLKPGNILVNHLPLTAVLGDCGFVSISKHSKTNRTAPAYRDPVVSHSPAHDMFSFGIIFLEFMGDLKIRKQIKNYDQFKTAIEGNIQIPLYQKILFSLLNRDHDKRMTARQTLLALFNEKPPLNIIKYEETYSGVRISREDSKMIYNLVKKHTVKRKVGRGIKGYNALIYYIESNNINPKDYKLCCIVLLFILASNFNLKSDYFNLERAMAMCDDYGYRLSDFIKILTDMLQNRDFVTILMSPSERI